MLRAVRFLLLLALTVSAPLTAANLSFGGAEESHARASLVAADTAVQPGRELVVALRLVHEPHWHTYWVNPGTGYATSLTWKLPPGWKAGEIQWPAPGLIRDRAGTITGNGYDGDLLLPVVLTPPADLKPGERVTLAASAAWLVCSEVCIPGEAEVELVLPVSANPPAAHAEWGPKIRETVARLPRGLSGWSVTATREGKVARLHVTPPAGNAAAPKDPWFFSTEGVIAFDQPQKVTADGRGGFTLEMTLAVDAPKDANRLLGVLTSEQGWNPEGTLRGLAVDAPFDGSPAGGGTVTSGPTNGVAATGTSAAGGLGGTLLLAFIGGLILNLMPCVFPVIGIKILGFVNQAGHERGRVVAHGLIFALGVLLSFWALAGVLAILRASGDQLGWGFQLQSPAFVYALAVLMLAFGMNMSGVFEFGLSATAVGSNLQMKSGYAGSFFSGVLATVVATPCSAPFLAPALGAALAVSTVASFAIFTAIAIGLATPYLLLSIFPAAVKALPRPGAWMETFKQFMAFPLYATAAYLAWVLAAQTTEEGFRGVLFSFVLIALAIWMYGRWTAPGASAGRVRFGVTSLILVGALALWVGWPRALPAATTGVAPTGEVVWQPWSKEAVAQLRAEGRIVYVDFTARWCATCQTNKKLVFGNGEVLRTFAEKKVATLRADWTNRDPRITAELAAYGRSAVPFNLLWLPGKDDPVVLPELLTAGTVLEAMKGGKGT